MDEWYWLKVRMQFVLKPDLVYLNTGTEGSMPRIALKKMQDYFKQFASSPYECIITPDQPMGSGLDMECSALAEFLGADKDEIVITSNTTEGLGTVANGLDLQEGDEVLSTTQFAPYSACWYVLRDRKKIALTEIELPIKPQTSQEIIDLFEQAITPQTKIMSFCHINYTHRLLGESAQTLAETTQAIERAALRLCVQALVLVQSARQAHGFLEPVLANKAVRPAPAPPAA